MVRSTDWSASPPLPCLLKCFKLGIISQWRLLWNVWNVWNLWDNVAAQKTDKISFDHHLQKKSIEHDDEPHGITIMRPSEEEVSNAPFLLFLRWEEMGGEMRGAFLLLLLLLLLLLFNRKHCRSVNDAAADSCGRLLRHKSPMFSVETAHFYQFLKVESSPLACQHCQR